MTQGRLLRYKMRMPGDLQRDGLSLEMLDPAVLSDPLETQRVDHMTRLLIGHGPEKRIARTFRRSWEIQIRPQRQNTLACSDPIRETA
jgi:hypothetical protein